MTIVPSRKKMDDIPANTLNKLIHSGKMLERYLTTRISVNMFVMRIKTIAIEAIMTIFACSLPGK